MWLLNVTRSMRPWLSYLKACLLKIALHSFSSYANVLEDLRRAFRALHVFDLPYSLVKVCVCRLNSSRAIPVYTISFNYCRSSFVYDIR